MRVSIRTRILLYFVALTSLLLVGFASLLFLALRWSLVRGLDDDLRARATALAALVERDGETWEVELEGAAQPSRDLVRNLTAWAILTYPEAKPLLKSHATRQFDELKPPGVVPSGNVEEPCGVRPAEWAGRFETLGRERSFVGVFAVRDEFEKDDESEEAPGEAPDWNGPEASLVTVVVVADLAPVDRTLRALLGTLAAIGVTTFLLAAGAGTLLARRIVRPLAGIAKDAESVRVPDRLRELRGSGTGDEIDRLATTLNRAFVRLREAYERQTRFTADASHELRTPVSTIRSQAEVALRRDRTVEEYRETLGVVEGEARRLGELIEALLIMARFDSGKVNARMEQARLDEIARSAVAEFAPAAEAEQVKLRFIAQAHAPVHVDRHLMTIALRNLLSNALRHASRPGSVEVRVGQSGNEAILEVGDDGSGIPTDALEHVFERFYRADSARGRATGGGGLGLPIVAEIVRHHGGTVEVSSPPGKGAEFTVRLPASRSD